MRTKGGDNESRILQSGAAMTEYVIIVALIAIFCIGAVSLFGAQIDGIIRGTKGKLDTINTKIGGGGGGGVVIPVPS